MADPLDKQLVEAVLSSRPRRTKRELEEAKLATMRPRRAGAAVAPVSADPDADLDDDEDDDDEDLDLTLEEGAEPAGRAARSRSSPRRPSRASRCPRTSTRRRS